MSFWSRLVGGLVGRVSAEEAVLAELESALNARSAEQFASLCARHADQFHRWFPIWIAALQETPDQGRQTALYAAARWVAEERQDKSLMFTYFRPTAMDGTEDTLVSIDELEAEGAFDDAITTLERSLRQPGLTEEGRAALSLRLGQLQFGAGRIAEAESRFRESAAKARARLEYSLLADAETWLFELARWRGDGPSAGMHADGVAACWRKLERPERARDWSQRSTLVRQGEPLVRAVVRLPDGRCLEPDSTPVPLPEGAELVLARNRPDFPPGARKLKEGRGHLAGRRFKVARECFREAGSLDVHTPEPWYELGMMYLDADDMVSAARAFARVEQLAPGWQDVRAHAAIRDAIVENRAAPAVWRFRRDFACGTVDFSKLLAVGEDLVTRWDIGSLWLDLGRLREWSGHKATAAEAYAAGLKCKSDPSTKTWLLVRYSQLLDPSKSSVMLNQAVLVAGDHLAAAEAKLRLRALQTPA